MMKLIKQLMIYFFLISFYNILCSNTIQKKKLINGNYYNYYNDFYTDKVSGDNDTLDFFYRYENDSFFIIDKYLFNNNCFNEVLLGVVNQEFEINVNECFKIKQLNFRLEPFTTFSYTKKKNDTLIIEVTLENYINLDFVNQADYQRERVYYYDIKDENIYLIEQTSNEGIMDFSY